MWKLTENFPDITYWKSVFLDIFCPLLTLLLVALENLVSADGPEPTWSLKIGFGSKGIQNEDFRFSPFFLLIEFGQTKQKVENGSCSRHSCVNQRDFKCMYDMSYESSHSQL